LDESDIQQISSLTNNQMVQLPYRTIVDETVQLSPKQIKIKRKVRKNHHTNVNLQMSVPNQFKFDKLINTNDSTDNELSPKNPNK